jgi:hypothetical protein
MYFWATGASGVQPHHETLPDVAADTVGACVAVLLLQATRLMTTADAATAANKRDFIVASLSIVTLPWVPHGLIPVDPSRSLASAVMACAGLLGTGSASTSG